MNFLRSPYLHWYYAGIGPSQEIPIVHYTNLIHE